MKQVGKFFQIPFVNVFLFSLFWALTIIVSKMAFNQGAHPVTYLIQSTVISLILLAVYVIPQKYQEIISMPKQVFWGLMGANAIHLGIGAFFSNVGTALTSAVNVGFLGKFATVITIFLAWLFLKEKLTKSKVVAAVIMIVGVFLITTKGQVIIPHPGDILILWLALLGLWEMSW